MIHIYHNGDGAGDWVVIRGENDAPLYSGHKPTPQDICYLLRHLGLEVEWHNITDEQMEQV